jgi:hypothetical protein
MPVLTFEILCDNEEPIIADVLTLPGEPAMSCRVEAWLSNERAMWCRVESLAVRIGKKDGGRDETARISPVRVIAPALADLGVTKKNRRSLRSRAPRGLPWIHPTSNQLAWLPSGRGTPGALGFWDGSKASWRLPRARFLATVAPDSEAAASDAAVGAAIGCSIRSNRS